MVEKIKYKSIGERKEDIFNTFIGGQHNLSRLARDYLLPYSTLRRFIQEELKKRDLEDQFLVQYINIDDFPYLRTGDTFQFDPSFRIWRVVDTTVKESDKVFILVATNIKAERHFICEELQGVL